LNQVAGNGVNEALGWGWKGWEFWWKERELWSFVMDGVNTPFIYRLFKGRRGGRRGGMVLGRRSGRRMGGKRELDEAVHT